MLSTPSKNWNDLADINAVTDMSSMDNKCIDEVRSVIEKYGLTDRFGVAVLHKHFDIDSDEILLERCDTKNRTLTISPVKMSDDIKGDIMTTMYRFDNGVAYGCSYCNRNHHSE